MMAKESAPRFTETFMPTGGMLRNPGSSTARRGELQFNPVRRRNAIITKEWLDAFQTPDYFIVSDKKGNKRFLGKEEFLKGASDYMPSEEDKFSYLAFLNRPVIDNKDYETEGHETSMSWEAVAENETLRRKIPDFKDGEDWEVDDSMTLSQQLAYERRGMTSDQMSRAAISENIVRQNQKYLSEQYEEGINDAIRLADSLTWNADDLTADEVEDALDTVELPEDNIAYSEGFLFFKKVLEESYDEDYNDGESFSGTYGPFEHSLVRAAAKTGGEIGSNQLPEDSTKIIDTQRMVIKR